MKRIAEAATVWFKIDVLRLSYSVSKLRHARVRKQTYVTEIIWRTIIKVEMRTEIIPTSPGGIEYTRLARTFRVYFSENVYARIVL